MARGTDMKRNRIFIWMLSLCLLIAPVAHGAETKAGEHAPVRVAFLDSGVATAHLNAAQVEKGENFVFPEKDTQDRVGHGTATAGLVLGSDELGLSGLCPTAVIVPLVCYDVDASGEAARCSAAELAAAIYAAVDEYDCRILNISLGTTADDPALREAVAYAQSQGALLLSSVGNDNLTHPTRIYYPAAYEGVIGVGAANGGETAAFSQRSNVDVLAPGVALETVTNRSEDQSERRSGTSFACAYVSGVCAAIWTAQPDLSAEEVSRTLFSIAEDVGEAGFDADSGWGLVTIDAYTPAVRLAGNLSRWTQRCAASVRALSEQMTAVLRQGGMAMA